MQFNFNFLQRFLLLLSTFNRTMKKISIFIIFNIYTFLKDSFLPFLGKLFMFLLFIVCYLFYLATPILFDSDGENDDHDGGDAERHEGNPDYEIGDDVTNLTDDQLQERLSDAKRTTRNLENKMLEDSKKGDQDL